MRLLLDQNISARLLDPLQALFPGSAHVRLLGLAEADDEAIWAYAARHGFTIVSKDADFHQMSFVRGAPPKVIWIRLGNCTTDAVEKVLRDGLPIITDFERDQMAAFLLLS